MLVQLKVNTERRAARRAERVVHVLRSPHAAEHAGDAFRTRKSRTSFGATNRDASIAVAAVKTMASRYRRNMLLTGACDACCRATLSEPKLNAVRSSPHSDVCAALVEIFICTI
jgi:hypothetical protein